MIKPKLCRNQNWLSSVPSLGRRQENLFFHPDVPKQSGSKMVVGSLHHLVCGNNGCLKKLF